MYYQTCAFINDIHSITLLSEAADFITYSINEQMNQGQDFTQAFAYFLWRETKLKFNQKINEDEFSFDPKAILDSLHILIEDQIKIAKSDCAAANKQDEETLKEIKEGENCRQMIEYHLIRLFAQEGELDKLEEIIKTKSEETQARMQEKLQDASFMGSMMNHINSAERVKIEVDKLSATIHKEMKEMEEGNL